MRIEKRRSGWWIFDHQPAIGPFGNRKETNECLQGMKNFYQQNPIRKEDTTMEAFLVLANYADSQGMWCKDVAARPELLKKAGLNPSQLTPLIISQAERHNRNEIEKIMDTYHDKPFPPLSFVGKNTEVLGVPFKKLVQWMGSEMWDVEEVEGILSHLGAKAKSEVILKYLEKGEKKRKTVPEDVEKEIYKILEIVENL